MASEHEFGHTVDLSKMTLSPVSDALIEKIWSADGVRRCCYHSDRRLRSCQGARRRGRQQNPVDSLRTLRLSVDDVGRGIDK